MDRPISVGDLVVVVCKGVECACNSGPNHIGKIFRVGSIERMALVCTGCGYDKGIDWVAVPEDRVPFGISVFRLPRLKRIPPMDELEGLRHDEKLKEPA